MSNNTFSNAPAVDPGPIDLKKMFEVIERCPKPVVYIELPTDEIYSMPIPERRRFFLSNG